jgi:predicted small lipoprotein YifL
VRTAVLLAVLLTLAACGVDGAPKTPTPDTGVGVSGEVAVGVSGQL